MLKKTYCETCNKTRQVTSNNNCIGDNTVLKLQSILRTKVKQAVSRAEKNTVRNSSGEVILPMGDEWRNDDIEQ